MQMKMLLKNLTQPLGLFNMIFLLPFLIAIASALHGYGRVAKILPTLALCAILPIMLYYEGCGTYSLAGVAMAWIWRIFLRNGNQAYAELRALDNRVYASRGLEARLVWKAHYYNPFGLLLGWIITHYMTYSHTPYKVGDSEGRRFFDTRRKVEIVSGFLPQSSVIIVIYLLLTVVAK